MNSNFNLFSPNAHWVVYSCPFEIPSPQKKWNISSRLEWLSVVWTQPADGLTPRTLSGLVCRAHHKFFFFIDLYFILFSPSNKISCFWSWFVFDWFVGNFTRLDIRSIPHHPWAYLFREDIRKSILKTIIEAVKFGCCVGWCICIALTIMPSKIMSIFKCREGVGSFTDCSLTVDKCTHSHTNSFNQAQKHNQFQAQSNCTFTDIFRRCSHTYFSPAFQGPVIMVFFQEFIWAMRTHLEDATTKEPRSSAFWHTGLLWRMKNINHNTDSPPSCHWPILKWRPKIRRPIPSPTCRCPRPRAVGPPPVWLNSAPPLKVAPWPVWPNLARANNMGAEVIKPFIDLFLSDGKSYKKAAKSVYMSSIDKYYILLISD